MQHVEQPIPNPAATAIFFAVVAILLVTISLILPTACDRQLASEDAVIEQHKAELKTYISPADQAVIDIKNHQGE